MMPVNTYKIALRSLWKHRVFSAINICGLAIGIATCLLITLYVQYELSFDAFNEKRDQIARVTFRGKMNGGEIREASVMPPVAQTFKKDFPEVLDATRLRDFGTPRIAVGNKIFKDEKVAFVDANFLSLFTLPLLQGNAGTALQQPHTVVISYAAAKKYFGTLNAIGKVLTFKDMDNASFTVTGVYNEVPSNSHFASFGLLASLATLPEARENSWLTSNFYTYLLLPKNYDYKSLEAKLPQAVEKYIGPQLQQAMGLSVAEFKKGGNSIAFALQPLTSIHLYSDVTGDMKPAGNKQSVYSFGAVAIFMLLIACINFMNLSTASASKRAKEVGVRKVMGVGKSALVRQFMGESVFLALLALCLALLLVSAALPYFNRFTGLQLSLPFGSNPFFVPALLVFGLFTGVLAGSYPAFFLSSFNPVAVLKGQFTPGGKGSAGVRSALVVFQFFIAASLIIATVVVFQQLVFIQNKKLGYQKDQVIVVQDSYWLGNNAHVFKQQLLQDPRVLHASTSGFLPAGQSYNNNFLVYADQHASHLVNTLRYEVDYDYIPTLGMEITKGRNFSKDYGADTSAIIINETAARAFGWNADALEHTLTQTNNEGKSTTYKVIGVVKDFHFRSLHQSITPLVMTLGADNANIIIKAKTTDVAPLLASIKNKWDKLTTASPFRYSFLDERYSNTYATEQKMLWMMGIFAGLTIFVACLGLFALATFLAEQRRKEIGIRKVLGAKVSGIVSLLSKDFLQLVLLAFVIAMPVAFIIMSWWLQEFAYRIHLSGWTFLLAGIFVLLIAFITVSFQSVKAALANPVKNLRNE